MHRYQAEIEELPDQFLQLEYAEKLMIVRRKVAELVYADANEIAFVTNATTGVNVILRSFDFGVRSGIVHFSSIYPSCGQTIELLVDHLRGKVFS